MQKNYKSSYKTARAVHSFIAFVGWVQIFLSTFFCFAIYLSYKDFYIVLPVYMLALIGGILLIATGQIVRAVIDTADNTGEMLHLIKSAINGSDLRETKNPSTFMNQNHDAAI